MFRKPLIKKFSKVPKLFKVQKRFDAKSLKDFYGIIDQFYVLTGKEIAPEVEERREKIIVPGVTTESEMTASYRRAEYNINIENGSYLLTLNFDLMPSYASFVCDDIGIEKIIDIKGKMTPEEDRLAFSYVRKQDKEKARKGTPKEILIATENRPEKKEVFTKAKAEVDIYLRYMQLVEGLSEKEISAITKIGREALADLKYFAGSMTPNEGFNRKHGYYERGISDATFQKMMVSRIEELQKKDPKNAKEYDGAIAFVKKHIGFTHYCREWILRLKRLRTEVLKKRQILALEQSEKGVDHKAEINNLQGIITDLDKMIKEDIDRIMEAQNMDQKYEKKSRKQKKKEKEEKEGKKEEKKEEEKHHGKKPSEEKHEGHPHPHDDEEKKKKWVKSGIGGMQKKKEEKIKKDIEV